MQESHSRLCYRTLTFIIYNRDGGHVWVTPHDTNVLSWLWDLQCKKEGLVSLKGNIINDGDAEAFLSGTSWEADWKLPAVIVSSVWGYMIQMERGYKLNNLQQGNRLYIQHSTHYIDIKIVYYTKLVSLFAFCWFFDVHEYHTWTRIYV